MYGRDLYTGDLKPQLVWPVWAIFERQLQEISLQEKSKTLDDFEKYYFISENFNGYSSTNWIPDIPKTGYTAPDLTILTDCGYVGTESQSRPIQITELGTYAGY